MARYGLIVNGWAQELCPSFLNLIAKQKNPHIEVPIVERYFYLSPSFLNIDIEKNNYLEVAEENLTVHNFEVIIAWSLGAKLVLDLLNNNKIKTKYLVLINTPIKFSELDCKKYNNSLKVNLFKENFESLFSLNKFIENFKKNPVDSFEYFHKIPLQKNKFKNSHESFNRTNKDLEENKQRILNI